MTSHFSFQFQSTDSKRKIVHCKSGQVDDISLLHFSYDTNKLESFTFDAVVWSNCVYYEGYHSVCTYTGTAGKIQSAAINIHTSTKSLEVYIEFACWMLNNFKMFLHCDLKTIFTHADIKENGIEDSRGHSDSTKSVAMFFLAKYKK